MDLDAILDINNEVKKEHGDSKVESWQNENQAMWVAGDQFEEMRKTFADNEADFNEQNIKDMALIIKKIGGQMGKSVDDKETQAYIKEMHLYLEKNLYKNCPKDKLEQIINLYIDDAKFIKTIDAVGGKGCTQYLEKAIKFYCKN